MALNAKMEEHGGGSKYWTKDRHDDSECRTEDVALNAKLKIWLWKPNWRKVMALNAKMKIRLWTPNWKGDLDVKLEVNNDSERQIKNE